MRALTSNDRRAPSSPSSPRPSSALLSGAAVSRTAPSTPSGAIDAVDAIDATDARVAPRPELGGRTRPRVEAPRAAAGRRSWLRRVERGARGAVLGALLVGSSLGLSCSGASDHSAELVARPPAVEVPASTIPHQAPPSIAPRPAPAPAPAPTAAERAEARLAGLLAEPGARIEYGRDFADPFVLRSGGQTYFYATNAHLANVPVLDAQMMLEGAVPRDALPTEGLGRWAVPNISHVWAPSVAELEDGRYAMFYSAQERSTGLMAVGVAFSSSPMGPFADASPTPLLSAGQSGEAGRGGVIDASTFQEDGRTWLVFKNDGNSSGRETAVWLQELSPGGEGVLGQPTKLLGDAGHQAWEEAGYTAPHALIEGPHLHHADGKYYLFYCANDWASASYGVNYAVSDDLSGPFVRAPGPWMQSEPGRFGPGGPEIFEGPAGRLYLAYHAWTTPAADGAAGDARRLVIEPISLEAGGARRPAAG